MENSDIKYIKYICLILVAFWAMNKCHAQVAYQRMDSSSRAVEKYITKAQIQSNTEQIKYLNEQKNSYSLFNKNESIARSRQQAMISAKENENFRLNHKIFLINKAQEMPLTIR
jgi:hypothetical protein